MNWSPINDIVGVQPMTAPRGTTFRMHTPTPEEWAARHAKAPLWSQVHVFGRGYSWYRKGKRACGLGDRMRNSDLARAGFSFNTFGVLTDEQKDHVWLWAEATRPPEPKVTKADFKLGAFSEYIYPKVRQTSPPKRLHKFKLPRRLRKRKPIARARKPSKAIIAKHMRRIEAFAAVQWAAFISKKVTS